MKIFGLCNFFRFLVASHVKGNHVMPTNTRNHWKILENCFIVGQDKVQDVLHISLSTDSRTTCWRLCFSSNSNSFLAGEKGADVIELLLVSIFGMLKSVESMMLWLLILYLIYNREASSWLCLCVTSKSFLISWNTPPLWALVNLFWNHPR